MLRAVVFVALVAFSAEAASGSPVGKVLELLGNLKDKVKSEGKTADQQHVEFKEYCRSMNQELEHNIERNQDKRDEFAATQQKADSQIERLTSEIAELAGAIQKNEEDLAGAEKLRKEQNEEFLAGQRDLEDTVDTLVRAMGVLRKAGLGLLQTGQVKAVFQRVTATLSTIMDAAIVDSASRTKLQSMLQAAENADDDDDSAGFANPEAKKYESHSGGIIDMIEELKGKAEAELSDLRKDEMGRQHEFDMLKQSLTDSINTANRDRKNDQNSLAQNQETSGKAVGDLAEEENSLSTNQAGLKDLVSTCAQRNKDYEAEVVSRNEELEALGKAIEILTDPAFAAANQGRTDFLQLSGADDARARAVAIIRSTARQFRSVALAQLAIRAGEDQFGKVKGLIREMIDRLKKQAAEEADHNAYCVQEKKENTAKRDDISGKRDNFAARLEKAQANEAQLKEEIAQLSGDIMELDKNIAAATKLRQEESTSYTQAAEEFRVGLDGLARATSVLKDYYAAKGDHAKQSNSATGIIAMLETAEQDMSNGQAEAEIAEGNAAKDFEKMMQESQVNKASMEAAVKGKTSEMARVAEAITDLKSDVEGAEAELKAVLDYLEKLKGSCEHKPQSFADRAAARQKEIESLKMALEILENETAGEFLQRS